MDKEMNEAINKAKAEVNRVCRNSPRAVTRLPDIEAVGYLTVCPACEAPALQLCFHKSPARKARGERVAHPHKDRVKAALRAHKVMYAFDDRGSMALTYEPRLGATTGADDE